MRTAILLSAIILRDGISEKKTTDREIKFIVVFLLSFVIMDTIDFVRSF